MLVLFFDFHVVLLQDLDFVFKLFYFVQLFFIAVN